jgi:phospholipid-binding lipoprotein MlaA
LHVFPPVRHARPATLAALVLAGALAACGPAQIPAGINDPHEAQNRATHDANRELDRVLLRPASRGYGSILPEPVRKGIGNFAANLDTPGDVLNNLLQLRLDDAAENTLRFVLNTTVGIGGLFDPATAIGIYGESTDFGETLHVWGAPEGAYVELPIAGPSTERDALGGVVDILLNPVRLAVPTAFSPGAIAADIASAFGTRYEYSDMIDSVLYESADSYAQARLFYLQNRRFELGGGVGDNYVDPYEDVESAYGDPITDPYFDPYAE